MKKSLQLPSAIAFIVLLVSPLFAGDWIRVETANFVLVGIAGEKNIRKVGFKLEQFRKILSLALPNAKLDSTTPTYVYIFEDDQGFKPYKYWAGQEKNKDKESLAGYFIPTPEGNYVALANSLSSETLYRIIYHEYFHFVMHKNLRKAPLWLNEGLAEYYSSIVIDDDGLKFKLGTPIPSHVYTFQRRPPLPFEKLFAVDHRSPEYNESDKVGIFYSQSWALVHYLLEGDNEKYHAKFSNFINILSTEKISSDQAFQKAYQVSAAQVEKELDQYIRRFTFPVVDYTLKEKVNWDASFKSAPISKAEEASRLGDLLVVLRRFDEAENKFQEALKLDANFAPAYFSIGKIRLSQKNFTEAKKNFEKSISLSPDDYSGHSYLGKVLWDLRDVEGSLRSYQKAASLNPNIASVQSDLGSLYEAAGRDKEAITAYNRAMILEPKEAYYQYRLSHVLFRSGADYQAAIKAITFITLAGWDDDRAVYMALLAYFGYRRQNLPDRAQITLKDALANIAQKEWGYSILRYLNKEIDRDGLLRLASNTGEKTEAYAYTGFDLLLENKTDEALKCFEWVRDNGSRNYVEYDYALKEIERIKTAAAQTLK